ncbi:type II toxin-antitoxin system VapC family toxin (plasmid) [Sphingomonas panni]|uniref:type II toxin-antitoxin system VapC family toxin n=1 Tax=Sphingomonas hankookensis TaxID=563996 RepID=UPI003D302800
MTHILLDTHAWAWSMTADPRLSNTAIAAIEQAETVSISAISLFEIGQKVRLGKWPEMAPFLNQLIALAHEQGGRLAEVSPEASLLAATLAWDHRDPFDRLIAATAITRGLGLVSTDVVFDDLAGMPGWPGRIW